MLCRAVLANRLEGKRTLNFPDASPEERKDAVSRKVARSSSSEYTGVSWNKRNINWNVWIKIRDKEGRRKTLNYGTYEDERDAALAFDRHASVNHPS